MVVVEDRFPPPGEGDEGDDSGEGDSDAAAGDAVGGDDQPMMADAPPKTMGVAGVADSAGDTPHWSTSWSN